jgi:hypothetical protein
VNGEQATEGTVTAWYDLGRRHWRWHCVLCNEEHGTGAIERDYDGPVQTAMRDHIDHIHPDRDVVIEIKNTDGDVNDGD